MLFREVRHPSREDVLLPLVEQRPAHSAGAEVGHVLILRQPIDRLLDNAVIAAKDRAMTGQQILRIIPADPTKRVEELGEARTVMRVDNADAAVLVDIVAREE